jgi:hypothetical protein
MSTTTPAMKHYEGRVYSNFDVHAGALVWISRRKTIEKLLLKDYPNLSPVDLIGVLRGVELYATCNEDLFCELEGRP